MTVTLTLTDAQKYMSVSRPIIEEAIEVYNTLAKATSYDELIDAKEMIYKFWDRGVILAELLKEPMDTMFIDDCWRNCLDAANAVKERKMRDAFEYKKDSLGAFKFFISINTTHYKNCKAAIQGI
jgi:hypothetical protein